MRNHFVCAWIVLSFVGLLLSAGCRPASPEVSTIAGGDKGYLDGKSTSAQFDTPLDVAVDSEGNLYVADSNNHCIRKITPDGTVTTLAGTSEVGYVDGAGNIARFSSPTGIAVGTDNRIFVADSVEKDPHPMHVRQINMTGEVTTLAGGSEAGYKDGPGTKAFFRTPANLAVDSMGNVYVADTNNNRIRKVTPQGMVSTFAGPTDYGFFSGYVDGPAEQARFKNPNGVVVDLQGNVYVADTGNQVIRKISPDGTVSTLAGSPEANYADGKGTEARFNYPTDIAVDSQGNVYVADSANHRIRKITPDGMVTTIAGKGTPGFSDGPASEAQFRLPQGLSIDQKGNLYIADTGNNRIRKLNLGK